MSAGASLARYLLPAMGTVTHNMPPEAGEALIVCARSNAPQFVDV